MRKILSPVLAAALVIVSLSACGGSSAGTSQPGTTGAPTENTAAETAGAEAAAAGTASSENGADESVLESVSIMCNYKAAEAPGDSNDLLAAIRDYSGTEIKMMWVPNDAYEEKFNTLMASSSLPAITILREVKSAGFINAARAGMFWDLGPYVDQFENIGNIDKTIMKNVQTDGVQYLIPRTRDTIRAGLIIRTDWLEKLGLKMPETLEELHDVLYAFTFQDPDGNGQDDTYGLATYDQGLKNVASQICVYMGGVNIWGVDGDGNLFSQYGTPEYTQALDWLRSCYAEGLMNNDFPVSNDKTGPFTDGKAGCLFLGNMEDATTTLNSLTQVNPDATVDVTQILLSETGSEPHIPGYQGYNGALAIPKAAVKDEGELLKVLTFIDQMGDDTIVDLFNWGIEGKSYDLKDGKVTQTEEQQKIYADEYNLIRQITPFYASVHLEAAELTPVAQHVRELLNSNAKYAVQNPALPFLSETETEMGGSLGELATFITDSEIKYVIGEYSADDYANAVEKWNSMGGAKIAEEFSEQYQAAN